jgi:enoyl-CoA hydratase/carnithine racemase
MAEHVVVVSIDGRVATVTVNRPDKLNALNAQVRQDFVTALEELRRNEDVRVVIVTGAGDKAFVAGADIKEFTGLSGYDQFEITKGFGIFEAPEKFPKPVIAAINGFALGGGCELAMACDIRIASDRAKLGQPEINLGILPGGGGTQRLPRLVGLGNAYKLLYTGNVVGAEEALRIGLVDEVVAPDELHARALALAAEVAGGALTAQAIAKRVIDEGLSGSLADGLLAERAAFVEVFETDDSQIGVASFLEHGPGKAEFTGG